VQSEKRKVKSESAKRKRVLTPLGAKNRSIQHIKTRNLGLCISGKQK